MADFTEIIQEINTNLPDNNTQAITAAKLRTTLIDLVDRIDTVQDDFETEVNETLTDLVIDNLTSTSTTNALSANQGRILNETIDDVSHSVSDLSNRVTNLVIDNLTTDDATKALSAKQGKILYDQIKASSGNVEEVNITSKVLHYYLLQDGTTFFAGNSAWSYVTYNLDSSKIYKANLSTPSSTSQRLTCGIQYFDANNNFLGYEAPGQSTYQLNFDVEMNVPANATWCRIQTNETIEASVLYEMDKKPINEVVIDLQSSTKVIETLKFKSKVEHYYLLQDGTTFFAGNSVWSYVTYNLDSSKIYKANLSTPSSTSQRLTCGIQYFDANNNFLGYEAPGQSTYQLNFDVEMNVPANATWCRIQTNETIEASVLYEIENTPISKTVNQIENNLEIFTKSKNGVIYNYDLTNVNNYSDLSGYNTSNISSSGYTPSTGWQNRVQINKYIVADNIATNYEVNTSSATIVVGSIDAAYTKSVHATLLKINFNNGKVYFLTGENENNIDGTVIPEYVYQEYTMTNISESNYRIELGRKNRCPYVKIYNLKTNTVCLDEILTIYETDSSYGGKAGAMYDYPVFGVLSGSCSFKRVFATVSPDYDVIFIGDSITEGSQLAISDVWANKVINSDYVRTGLNCGRGGGKMIHVLKCMIDIVSVINAKTVVVTIGTNGGNDINSLNYLKYLSNKLGVNLILNCVPMLRSGYPSTNDLIQTIDAIHCRFDVATAINNNTSSGQNTSLFFSDRTHPNVNGGIALFNCFMATVGSNIYV